MLIFLGEMGLKRILANRQQGKNLRKSLFWECTGLIVLRNSENCGELFIGKSTMCTEQMVNIFLRIAPLLKIMNKILVSLLQFAYKLSKLKSLELFFGNPRKLLIMISKVLVLNHFKAVFTPRIKKLIRTFDLYPDQ